MRRHRRHPLCLLRLLRLRLRLRLRVHRLHLLAVGVLRGDLGGPGGLRGRGLRRLEVVVSLLMVLVVVVLALARREGALMLLVSHPCHCHPPAADVLRAVTVQRPRFLRGGQAVGGWGVGGVSYNMQAFCSLVKLPPPPLKTNLPFVRPR